MPEPASPELSAHFEILEETIKTIEQIEENMRRALKCAQTLILD